MPGSTRDQSPIVPSTLNCDVEARTSARTSVSDKRRTPKWYSSGISASASDASSIGCPPSSSAVTVYSKTCSAWAARTEYHAARRVSVPSPNTSARPLQCGATATGWLNVAVKRIVSPAAKYAPFAGADTSTVASSSTIPTPHVEDSPSFTPRR